MGVPNDNLFAMILEDLEIEYALISMGECLASISL
jgi:hypothetical protein